jgi:pyridoxal phosphate enzyme (YggS family)
MESINKYKQVIEAISKSLNGNFITNYTKLLVVSKTRSIEQILNLYNEGQRDFGENYLNELIEKSQKLPADINWYMIGHLQTNKVKKLLSVPNLCTIESVDSIKLAKELNNYCHKLERNQLNIYLQINISKEQSKSGVLPEDVVSLYEEIVKECDMLKIKGIMSLGEIGNTIQFEAMQVIKLTLCEKFNLNKEEFILSIGTSDDFEKAIEYGSNEVRIGGLLFDF